MSGIVNKFTDKVFAQTRMPFLPLDQKQGEPKLVGNTEFTNPDDESDRVDLVIYFAQPKFTAKFDEDFGSNDAKQALLRQFILAKTRKELEESVA
jgi:hypothetical protein